MEVLRTHDTGHADSHLNWVICGASGYGLRDQRQEGTRLMENDADGASKVVAESQLFIGQNGKPLQTNLLTAVFESILRLDAPSAFD